MSLVQRDEETFEGKNGTKLFSQNWTPRGPKRATLIIVHGLHDHSSRYAWAAEELAKQGYAVYGFDLRGHGRSEGRPQWVESFDDYLEDLGRFVRLVRRNEPGRPLFLFGFSLGGNIVASYALRGEEGISGLILCGAGLKPPDKTPGFAISIFKILCRLLPNMGAASLQAGDFSRDPNVEAEMEKDQLISQKPVPNRTILTVIQTGERIRANASKLDTPLLLLQGTADTIVGPEGTRVLYERCSSADKTLKLYEGFYHDLLHEPEKQTVLNDMSGWLGKHS